MDSQSCIAFGTPFLNKGYPVKSAAAICGNAELESALKPVNPSHDGSDGALQWRDAANVHRLTSLKLFCTVNKLDWRALASQALFTIHELETDFAALNADLLSGTKSLETLTLNFCDTFERPAVSGRVPETRIKYANEAFKILNDYVSRPPKPAPIPIPQPIPVPPPIPSPSSVMSPQIIAILVQIATGLAEGIMAAIVKQIQAQGGLGQELGGLVLPTPTLPSGTAGSQPSDIGSLFQGLVGQMIPALQQNLENNFLPQIESVMQKVIAQQLASLNPTQPPK